MATAFAWASSPSCRASSITCSDTRSNSALEQQIKLDFFTKSSTDKGEKNRAVPLVGST